MQPWRNNEWVRRLAVFDFRSRSFPSASPAAPGKVSSTTAKALSSHSRSRRSGEFTRMVPYGDTPRLAGPAIIAFARGEHGILAHGCRDRLGGLQVLDRGIRAPAH